MAADSRESRFSALEETVKRQQRELERFRAIHEIQNLMSRFEYLHTANQYAKIAEMFAKKTPGVAAHVELLGNWEGNEGIQRLYGQDGFYSCRGGTDRTGTLMVQTNTTPVIEVAGDGETAKGVWTSPGFATVRTPDGKFRANWGWYKYGVDFVKEDGEWKFWHFRSSPLFHSPYEKSWVDIADSSPHREALLPQQEADTPCDERYGWGPDVVPTNHPLPPEPYQTFDEEKAY